MSRPVLLITTLLLVAACAATGLMRLQIDTDVVRSLPNKERVLEDGLAIFEHHPIHDQVAVDLWLGVDDRDLLVEAGSLVRQRLEESGLFLQVGDAAISELLPDLARHVTEHLPLLFTGAQLEALAPRFSPEQVGRRLAAVHQQLAGLEGVGQAAFVAADPLGLREPVLARLQSLAPTGEVTLFRGQLLSADGRHLLITGRPKTAGTDTAFARQLDGVFAAIDQELRSRMDPVRVALTPVGAYRAALDNERIIRSDVRLALLLATTGIALLLLVAFPRPQIGLLSLLPALAGTALALLVFSLVRSSISVIVLGFGGALISITVDHGIAYLLFLDRTHATSGKAASHEVRAIGLLALLTTLYAFSVLALSGFAIFTQLGLFTALGVLFSFLFIHLVFPRLFPTLQAAGDRRLPLQQLVDRLYGTGNWGWGLAALLALVLLPCARPDFQVSLSAMNTVTSETAAAEALIGDTWGRLGQRVFLLQEAPSIAALQEANDRLLTQMEQEMADKVVSTAFVPSMLFPGQGRSQENLAAWRAFWTADRVAQVREALLRHGAELGFASKAFAPFLRQLEPDGAMQAGPIPERYFPLLGINPASQGQGVNGFVTVQPGANYDAFAFAEAHADSRVFDADYFSARLGEILFSTFATMFVLIGASVLILLFVAYLNWQLTLLTLLPPAFAVVCTLGSLHLMGRSLDIPALMLSIVILGMGVDYAIFCVRAHQRYRALSHPGYGKVRCAVFLSGTSTMIGFGVLCMAQHSLLRSIGLTSLLGIGYSLLGTFLLLPTLLKRVFAPQPLQAGSGLKSRIRHRYRLMEAYPRMFARGKLRFDPMFVDLEEMMAQARRVHTVMDVGCGYGLPACWCLERFPGCFIHALEPDPERVAVAALALGAQGKLTQGGAPELPPLDPGQADVVLLLDMLHYVNEEDVRTLLHRAFDALGPEGVLVTRYTIRPAHKPTWAFRLEDSRIRLSGHRAWYRSAQEVAGLLRQIGFTLEIDTVSRHNPELIWQVARKGGGA